MEAQDDRFVNDMEAARILAVSPQTLRNYRHLGRGPAYTKRGRMVRYRLGDLLDYMAAGRIDPEARRGGSPNEENSTDHPGHGRKLGGFLRRPVGQVLVP
jgi:hypothetical protein